MPQLPPILRATDAADMAILFFQVAAGQIIQVPEVDAPWLHNIYPKSSQGHWR